MASRYSEVNFRARPSWAIVGISLAAFFACDFTPESQYWMAGSLRVPALILTMGLFWGPALAAWRRPATLLRTEHILIFGLFYWILFDAIQGSFHLTLVTREGVLRAFIAIAIFAAFIWIGSAWAEAFGRRPDQHVAQPDLSINFLFSAILICFFLGTLHVLLGCSFSLSCITESLSRPGSPPWLRRDAFGGWDAAIQNLRFFGFLVLPIWVALMHVERTLSWRVVIGAVLGLLFLALLIQRGGRRGVGTVVGASVLVWILLHPRLGFRQIVSVALVAGALLLVMQAMVAWRGVGIVTGFSEGRSLTLNDRSGIAVDKNLLSLSRATSVVPEFYPYSGSGGVFYMLTGPIPRSVVPAKPKNPVVGLLPVLGLRDRPGWSWTFSAVGDLFLIGGFLAVAIGGSLFGMAAHFANALLRDPSVRSQLIYGVTAMTLFVGLRALAEIISTGLLLAALWAILRLRHYAVSPRRSQVAPAR